MPGEPERIGFERVRVHFGGAVQGVGFRPFVYKLARELGLRGWVRNEASGLWVEAEGGTETLRRFLERLETERPPASVLLLKETAWLAAGGYETFEIRESGGSDTRTAAVLPDLATCADCLREITDPAQRRHRYPFTNCTRCGPRYTIVREIPYDRANTAMAEFALCEACRREYEDPLDRRFHAQPVACPQCGPTLSASLEQAVEALRRGSIVALKGIGGFQLMVDAQNTFAVERLRLRKRREAKPFAVMMPSLDAIREWAHVSPDEERLLQSSAGPIVLLRPHRRLLQDTSPYLGVMLPYSPLHYLLMQAFGQPLVATSGNLSDEPIAIDEANARARLSDVADFFLSHNRPIETPCDDSVARVSRSRVSLLRRARGYAPMPVRIGTRLPAVLAVGGHLKNTVSLAIGNQIVVSQHIGDLDTLETRRAFEQTIERLCRLYRFQPDLLACDLHPNYYSRRWALQQVKPVAAIQHHEAHAAACAAENEVTGPYLGVAWDGTGYGHDGTIWGSEVFVCDGPHMQRIAHLRPFLLAGGDSAARHCWRCAESLLWSLGRSVKLERVLERRINCVETTSMGRLFDAVASLLNVCHENRFEGESGLLLEALAAEAPSDAYPLSSETGTADWGPMIEAMLADAAPVSVRVSRFFGWLVEWIAALVIRTGLRQVVLSGGCFQNVVLTERALDRLEHTGARVFTHQRVPANDGGLSLGQAVLAGLRYQDVPAAGSIMADIDPLHLGMRQSGP